MPITGREAVGQLSVYLSSFPSIHEIVLDNGPGSKDCCRVFGVAWVNLLGPWEKEECSLV